MEAVFTLQAPIPIGPYSQAVKQGGWIFISGQLPLEPQSGKLAAGDIHAQTRQALHNLASILKDAGADLSQVVKTTVYVTDLHHFAAINEIYQQTFHKPFPARAVVQVAALPAGAQIEIDAIALQK